MELRSNLSLPTFRITNLTHDMHHKRISVKSINRTDALFTSILSLVLRKLSYKDNGIPRTEDKKSCKKPRKNKLNLEKCGITYGYHC